MRPNAKFKYDSSADKDAKVIARVCEIADARNISHVEGEIKAVDLHTSR